MDTPLACSLPPAELRERRAHIDAIVRDALIDHEAIDSGVRVRFTAGAATERALRELIAAEAECCPFLTIELRAENDVLVLDVTGPPDVQPVIAGLFAPAPA